MFPLALLDGTDEILYIQPNSQLPEERLRDVIDMATEGCKEIAEYLQRKVRLYGESIIGEDNERDIPL